MTPPLPRVMGGKTMQTRFSLELDLTTDEQLRLLQVWQYLVEFESGDALVPRELADYLAGANAPGDLPERRFEELIGTDDPGLEFIHAGGTKLRIYDRDGAANLRVLCKIIAHVIPRVIPLEFSFALIDEANHCYSGGIVVMKEGVAEIQTTDSLLARRGKQRLH